MAVVNDTPLTQESEALLALVDNDVFAIIDYEGFVARLRAIEAAAARRAIEGSGVVEALDGLLDYPYILDAWGCRGCQQETGHSPTCPVGKALAVWSAVKMGTDRLRDAKVHEALAALPRPEEPRVDEGHEQRRSNAWRSINGLTPDARP